MTNEELLAFVKKNPIGVTCGVLCLAFAGGAYYRGLDIPDIEDELDTKTAEADRHAGNVKNSVHLKEQLDALVAANKEVETRLVRASGLAINLQYFYKIISDTGVKMLDVRQTTQALAKSKSNYSPVGFTAAVQGDLEQLMHFLAQLESGARYVRVVTASCAVPQGQRSGPLTITLNLELLGMP